MSIDLGLVLRWVSISLFSVLVPVGIYVGRMNVRASRREIVRDLEHLFQFAKVDGRPLILPSFELVKYKYDPDANPDRALLGTDANAFRYYAFPVVMDVTLAFLGFDVAFVPKTIGADGQLSYIFQSSRHPAGVDHLCLLWWLYLDHTVSDTAHRQLRPIANFVLSILPAYPDGGVRHRGDLAFPYSRKHRH